MSSTLARVMALLLGGAVAGLVANAARPGGVHLATWSPPAECHNGEAGELAVPTEMAPAQAAELCGRPDVVLADARPAAKFADGHVAGAVHLPCDAAGQVAADALAHFERAGTIVVYGDSTDEARPVALSLARRHRDVRVAILSGGFPAWAASGLACESGPCVECTAGTAAREAPRPAPLTSPIKAQNP
jgi:rhodanese-related sulfurtransferase